MFTAETFFDVMDVIEVEKCRGKNLAYVSIHG